MANKSKNTAPTRNSSKSAGASKNNSAQNLEERDAYAYYDDLYEKKPSKKKKAAEPDSGNSSAEQNAKKPRKKRAAEEDLYGEYEVADTSEPTRGKKRSRREPELTEEERDVPPDSSLMIHRLMPYILGVVTLFIVACFLLATLDGAMGDLGFLLRNLFFGLFGWPAYFIPLVLINFIIYWRRYVDLGLIRRKIFFGISIPLLLSALIHSLAIARIYDGYKWSDWLQSLFGFKEAVSNWTLGVTLHGGGFFGGLFGGLFRCAVGYVGSVIIIVAVLALAIIFFVGLSPRHFTDMVSELIQKLRQKRMRKAVPKSEEHAAEDVPDTEAEEKKPRAPRKRKDPTPVEEAPVILAEDEDDTEDEEDEPLFGGVEIKPAGEQYDPDAVEVLGSIETAHGEKEKENRRSLGSLRPVSETEDPNDLGGLVDTIFNDTPSTPAVTEPTFIEITEAPVTAPLAEEGEDDEPEDDGITLPENAKKKQAYEQLAAYIFPPITLLRESTSPGRDEINAELRANAETLIEKLESFHVKLAKIEYSRGPTLTRYELYPAPGVKANAIKSLQLDIAMALQAKIRIEAPIPGKSAVGVEVPNKFSSTVAIRELIESEQFKNAKSKLYACLGKDITGEPIFIDIGKMPHLLIAGTTGSGKSVCINSIIISLLYKARPDEVQFIMIDPKKVEMTMYNNLPHLRVPVVTNVKKAAGTLNAAVGEMENRYELFENNFARDIDGYNRLMKQEDPDFIPLPRLVIVIDELADLMMSAPSEIESSIVRLAQKARAAGIHLIIGTQRPSVDVITGLIKANVPSRIAFAVASGIDSRTIIDMVGAEKLLGRGDMLFAPIGCQNPIRAQGTFVTDDEVIAVTNYVKENSAGAHYDDDFLSRIEKESEQIVTVTPGAKKPAGAASGSAECFDELFFDALKLAVESGTIATSFLQRNINVGFGRGARIIDRMAKLGFVSQPDRTRPRQVLLTSSQLAELIARDDKRIYGIIPQDETEE